MSETENLETKEVKAETKKVKEPSGDLEGKSYLVEEKSARRFFLRKQIAEEEKRQNKIKNFASVAAVAIFIVLIGFIVFLNYTFVPDIKGMNYQDAQKLLGEKGLIIYIEEEIYSEDVEKDGIVFYYPTKGDFVKKGTGVGVSVSVGSDGEIMQDFVGKHVSEISSLFQTQLETRVDTNEEQHRTDIGAGYIISQSPAPGTKIEADTKFKFVLSAGFVPAPDVVGMTLSDAKAALAESECQITVSTVEKEGISGTVVSQSLPPSTKLGADVTMELEVAK